MTAGRALPVLGAIAFAALLGSCTDPVYDSELASLPDDGRPNDQYHRAYQPCVLCHSSTGPASDDTFAIAGTIAENATSTKPLDGVEVLLVDAQGSSPIGRGSRHFVTNSAGNFWVYADEWPELAFPVKVEIYKGGARVPMVSHISREPSCAGCHKDPALKSDLLTSVGHVYFFSQ